MRFYILRNQEVVLASGAKEFGEWVQTADRVVSHTQVADVVTGSGLLYCLNRNGCQEPILEIHGAGKSIKDLEFKPPIFIGMRPPSVGLLERLLLVCEVAKGHVQGE